VVDVKDFAAMAHEMLKRLPERCPQLASLLINLKR
jgi:hypothetical protein